MNAGLILFRNRAVIPLLTSFTHQKPTQVVFFVNSLISVNGTKSNLEDISCGVLVLIIKL
jgi:hypothetical protein